MSNSFAPKKINTKKYGIDTRLDGQLIDDLVELGWEYSTGRMSRSGMFYFDQIMTRLGVLKKGQYWSEDVYKDHNCDH